jgi:hypothetical protein
MLLMDSRISVVRSLIVERADMEVSKEGDGKFTFP